MPYEARHLANFILDEGGRSVSAFTPMAIQKLIFFSHGWSLAFRDRSLVENGFEAWKYGPVIPVLWDEFKAFGNKIVTARARFTNPLTGEKSFIPYSIEGDDADFIRLILAYYAGFPAMVLSDLTHQAGTPWKIVRENMQKVANFGGAIDNELIRNTFLRMDVSWLARAEIKIRPSILT